MHISPDKLRETYRTLDSATIRSKLVSGELTDLAREMATAELASRESTGESPIAPPPPSKTNTERLLNALPGRSTMKVLLAMYIVYVLVCVLVVAADPPRDEATSRGYDGFFGVMATFAVGLPWSFLAVVLLRSVPFLGYYVYLVSPTSLLAFCWIGVPVNLLLFWLYFKHRE